MRDVCEFNCKERCTWLGEECLHPDKECFATVRKGVGVVMPKMTVMAPTVINVSNEVSAGTEDYDSEQSVILPRI